jgi:hypothetical protein
MQPSDTATSEWSAHAREGWTVTGGEGSLGTTAAAASARRRRMTALGAAAGVTVAVSVIVAIVLRHNVQRSPAMRLCRSSLGSAVVAASPTTVGDLRGWEWGQPNDPNRYSLQNAWPTATSNDFAAYCTTGSSIVYTFYAVGPDRTAMKLQENPGIQGSPPPAIPPAHG